MSRHIKEFLPLFFKEDHWKIRLLNEWETIVGSLHSKMRIEKVEEHTLIIGVYHSAWLQELYGLSSVLKQSINKHLGNSYIHIIKFKQATKAQPQEKKVAQMETFIYNKLVFLDENQKTALSKLKDIELQNALHHFLSRCYYQKTNQPLISVQ